MHNPDSIYYDTPFYAMDFQHYYPDIAEMIAYGSKVMDIGSGCGGLPLYLEKQRNCNAVAIDISAESVQRCKSKGLEAYKCDVESEVIPGMYDAAILAASLEHMVYPRGLLGKLRNNIVAGGYVIIAVPNTTDMLSRLRFLKGTCIKQSLGELFDQATGIQAAGHLHFWNKTTMVQLLDATGYKAVEWKWVTDPHTSYKEHSILAWPLVWAYHFLYKQFASSLFSEIMIVKAQKI